MLPLWAITAVAGGVLSSLAGIVTRKMWKRVTHTEAMVQELHTQLVQQSPPQDDISTNL